jgi:hypothetical protein
MPSSAMMSSAFRVLLVILAAGIAGCASTDKQKQDERVSSIPWAKPESWQGQGPFGGLMQGSR